MNPLLRLTAVVATTLALAHCGNSDAPLSARTPGLAPTTAKYDADVTRTPLGIPHIKARRAGDYGSVGYGLGYAFAEDNLCVLMDDVVTNKGERAKFFGRTGSYTIVPNGVTANNIDSDFFWKLTNTDVAIAKLHAGALPEARVATTGFKDGLNRYIREIKAGGHAGRHAACRDGAWLQEISDDDMYRRYYRLGVIASGSVFINGIAVAAPPFPGGSDAAPAVLTPAEIAKVKAAPDNPFAFFNGERPFGSNMYALGKDATVSGQPIVFGNPHFPWSGTERLYISHLTVPGKADIMGSSLYGVPAVLIGFNEKLAWSHTVSTAYRFTFYELTLVPGDPTSYIYNGATQKMTAVPITLDVLEADGSTSQVSRTLYTSKFGPMLTFNVSGVNILPWSAAKAYTLRDANAENDRLINQFFKWNAAGSLDEFKALHKSVLGIPWVNTVAAGPNSKAYYGDVSVVPNVSNAKVQSCSTSVQAQALAQLAPGLPLLDGSLTNCEWDTDADAPAPGIFGGAKLPTLERDDWVHNCNDSYWLTNPAQLITGYNRIIGAEATERSLRTRLCILQVQQRLAGTDGLPGDKFDLKNLQEIVLSSRIHSAELARDTVTNNLCVLGNVLSNSGPVDVAEACTVLENWDLRDNLDSRGGHVWREFFRVAAGLNGRWTTPFSAADPVNTPRGLNVAQPQMQAAFGDAVKRVGDSGIAMDATMGSLQHSGVIGDNVVPVFGGIGAEGAFTIVTVPTLSDKGYPISYGNSYIQTVTWEPSGSGFKPVAEGFITYSQSTDPASPHYFDFTQEYSAKRWHRFPFTAAEVAAAKVSERNLTE